MPAISVIIPIYNVEKYLRRCLDSVLNQTFDDWEAIMVNDGSPDNSIDIMKEYAARDKRFKVVTKQNGGLSDARNFGMPHAKGDYIMFLDSDDFIHPQTMEITYALAKRDHSDIVTFVYDHIYRPQLIIRHFLKLSTDDVIPSGITKRYDINKIKTVTTEDIFAYATERTHNKFRKNRKWKIKHCQVWKNLYKREILQELEFVKGILFEDVPWWSAVLLRKPRVTITRIPFYYYIPNFGGIVLSAKQLRILESLATGMKEAYKLYSEQADPYAMKKWQREFLWPFIFHAYSKIEKLKDPQDIEVAKDIFTEMTELGLIDHPYDLRTRKYRRRILRFIKK